MKCFWSLNQIEFDIGLGGNKKPAWGEGFTTIGHAVLNNSINFKNRLHKPGLSAVQPD